VAEQDPDRFPVEPEAESRSDESGERMTCPEPGCGWSVGASDPMAKARLGAHRWNAHGTKGAGNSGAAHRRRRKEKGSGSGGSSGSSAPARKAPSGPSVKASLRDGFRKLSALTYPVVPIPALYLRDTGDDVAEVVSRMASRNPRLAKWLEGSSDAMDYLALGTWAAGMVVAVGVQLGRIAPEVLVQTDGGTAAVPNPLVSAFGIDRLYREAVADFGEQGGGTAQGTPSEHVGNGEAPAAAAVDARPS
jgi:hypothetical protein